MSYKKRKTAEPAKAVFLPNTSEIRIAIVVSSWHPEITEVLFRGAKDTLTDAGISSRNILRKNVPGSFELPLGAKLLEDKADAVICLGCIIEGETKHADYISHAVAEGIMRLNLDYAKPFIFGVLTTGNLAQAKARSGGKYGNKGAEAATAALAMLAFKQ